MWHGPCKWPALVAVLCLAVPLAALAELGPTTPIAQSADERELITRATEFEQELERRGLILNEPLLKDYVAATGNRVVAAGKVSLPLRFNVLRDPNSNAFALPSGGIYVNLGLLARLENEAQLAHVLGHEAAHVTGHHAARQQQSRRRKVISAHLADLALMGTSVAYLPFIASMAHYSRELEQEADSNGLDYLLAAGYDPEGSTQVFGVLREIPVTESFLGSLYASHPDNAQREAAVRARLVGHDPVGNGRVGETEYLPIRLRALADSAELKLLGGQYELALRNATSLDKLAPKQPMGRYLTGEARRQMAAQPELAAQEQAVLRQTKYSDKLVAEMRSQQQSWLDAAQIAYGEALAIDSQFAPAHRGLGLVAHARGEATSMREHLSRYLALAPQARDRRYVEYLMTAP